MSIRVPLEHYPGLSRFVLDWIQGNPRATKFLPRSPWSGALQRAEGRRAEARRSTAAALGPLNRRFGLFVDDQLDRWSRGETVTIVAGQQVGFAGGPLYTLAKIATLIRMKRDLERAGTPATAMFWLATEDHDFDEVAQLCVPSKSPQRDLLCMRAARTVESKLAVGPQPVPAALIDELRSFYSLDRPAWLREGITFGDSFAELIAGIFGNEIVLVDSLLPELRRAGKPLFERIIRKWDAVEDAIGKRSNELSAAGYEPQVTPRSDSYSLLFELDANLERHRIDRPRTLPDPERVSTSALTRPLLQDFVLQPDVFVGGPAEVSYYAQISPLHELLGVAMPRVALRGHALVAPKRTLRLLERYGIEAGNVFTSPDDLLAERDPAGVGSIRQEAEKARSELMNHIEKIGELALPAEHASARRIHKSIGHIEYHFGKLTERAIQGLVRKDRERYAAARELVSTLYPDRIVQDRIVAWFSYWQQYGQQLVDATVEGIEPDAPAFEIISL